MIKRTLGCLLMINLCLSLSPQLFICDNRSLRGVKGIKVTISLSNEDSGVTTYQLQNDVELRLRVAGIKVDSDTIATLLVTVVIMKIEPSPSSNVIGRYGTVQLSMKQPVRLSRDPTVSLTAATWESGVMYLHGGADDFGRRCRDAVHDFTDAFVNNYLSVNER
jgi:hypothetical protein